MPKRSYKPLVCLSKQHKNRKIVSKLLLSKEQSDPQIKLLQPCTSRTLNSIELFLPTINYDKVDETLEPVLENTGISSDSSDDSDSYDRHPSNNTHTDNSIEFSSKLAAWAVEGNIHHSDLNKLLHILKTHSCFEGLPSDSRTLLRTPRQSNIVSVSPGSYYHFGIASGISSTLQKCKVNIEIPDHLKLHINVDGLPLAKSSGSQFWPILGALNEIKAIPPFIIGCYHGYTKPKSSNFFLKELVSDLNTCLHDGVFFNGRKLKINLEVVTCDAPARAFVKNIKGHNGYWGCDRCTQEGEYVDNRMTFPIRDAELRSNESFRSRKQEAHHTDECILEIIDGIDMVKDFPQDYMHLVCLGVMRKLVLLWMRGKVPVRLASQQINKISNNLVNVKDYIPQEFIRKPRSLKEVDRWKATEFRQLLLYTGPLVLKEALPKKYYTHFLAFSCALRILISPELVSSHLEVAQGLIDYFLSYFGEIYGYEQISYNVHSLIHITEDVKRLGPLDLFSAFKFENYLKDVKKLVRKSGQPLQQLVRRVSESRSLKKTHNYEDQIKTFYVEEPHYNGPMVQGMVNPQFKKCIFSSFTVHIKEKDNCIQLKDGSFFLLENICTNSQNKIVFIGRKFLVVEDFFNKPYISSNVAVVKASKLSERLFWSPKDVAKKVMKIPISENVFFLSVILHQ